VYIFKNLYGYYWQDKKYFPTLETCKEAINNLVKIK